MYITIVVDGNGDTGIIISKEKTCQRVKDLETDGSSEGYCTFEIDEETLYLADFDCTLTKVVQTESEIEGDYDWDHTVINAVVDKDCNEDGGTFAH